MKRAFIVLLSFILFVLLSMNAFAEQVKVNKMETHVSVRSEPSSKQGKKTVIGFVASGDVLEVVEEKVSYIKAKVADVKRGEVEGWFTTSVLKSDDKGQYIGAGGCTLRTAPKAVKSTADGYLWPKSRILKVLDKNIIWYKVKVGEDSGWVCAIYLDPIKKKE